ncbi:hypothetical protein KF707_03450 [Candidatus Obscuribacterales bacterium]|nr:hypothetical protein [Candidatus Obscuribacterales bacterium]MBX3135266.1 hypothetical protein [Candidatus Obscuribacterales bacterium]MBX3153104.1 hypothetical protein [Candidatus Obscuribacterales bacterium]
MARVVCLCLGLLFVAVGLIGFVAPGFLGMHLSVGHNMVNLATGVMAAYFGYFGSYLAAKNFCYVMGTLYGSLGVIGLIAPPGVPLMHGMGPTNHLLSIVPGDLEFGTADSVAHLLVGATFLYGGFSRYIQVEEPKPEVVRVFQKRVSMR